MNRENLEKLAAYLEALPPDYGSFRMDIFMSEAGEHRLADGHDPYECGTVACAIGHGPAAGIPLNEEEIKILRSADGRIGFHHMWEDYSDRVFFDSNVHDLWWTWCFSGLWSRVDDTPQGAVKRIRWLLDGKPLPPLEDFYTAKAVKLYNGETA